MPQYFFHINLELFADYDEGLTLPHELWKDGHQALAPFLRSHHSRRRPPPSTVAVQSHTETASSSASSQPSCAQATDPDFPHSNLDDKRLDTISIEGTDMTDSRQQNNAHKPEEDIVTKGIGSATSGPQTKGRYIPLDQKTSESAWGIVHLYRDAEETPALSEDVSASSSKGKRHDPSTLTDHDCTTLCILAVPSYLAPSDFLGFVGEETRDEVSHFRMIRTARANRYMVLMKFRNGKRAREWQKEWNGKVFNSMEPETCHVVFIASVTLSSTTPSTTFPSMKNDPFSSNPATTTAVKPIAPRTPSLIEFPTCPVCLERMDETTGLLTIPCQHVFHCTCLEKWSGGGCPVCRYTHDDFSSRRAAAIGLNTDPSIEPLECETCHADHNLWQCLICGKIGCGRYDAAHAFQHYQTTSHSFAMDMESKRVWDYEGDAYIHRIIQSSTNVPGDKLVELPSSRDNQTSALDPHGDHHNPFNSAETDTDSYDPIPRIKLDNLSLEYTHLLTSQLESQRVYYESLIGAAADKASQASSLASTSQSTITSLETELTTLRKNYTTLIETTLPALERETQRLTQRTTKFESLSRSLTADLQTEKSLSNHLMTRISFLESQSSTQQQEIKSLQSEKLDLQDQNRDLSFFISTQDKIRELDDVDQKNEIQSGILQVPVVHDPSSADADAETGTGSASGSGKKKKRNKGKGKASN